MNKANLEAIKEVLRWVILYISSWIIVQLVGQSDLVPENWLIKILIFTFSIPMRQLFVFGLTLVGRYIDKWLHEKDVKTPLDLKSLDILKK